MGSTLLLILRFSVMDLASRFMSLSVLSSLSIQYWILVDICICALILILQIGCVGNYLQLYISEKFEMSSLLNRFYFAFSLFTF